ncbi:MAG TPA: (2Fe-2S) ferredoxin domain-containing protein [Chthoniobacteraceae bacterium]|jgi:hypothetical protein|nr:(2Fe-2S) ferredoxin domain-containing protein [Chthoniobacteraceae bacterium]
MNAEPVITQNAHLRGVFAGFVRTLLGKRRMRLHRAGDELLLKVPKELRHVLEARLTKGQEVVVWGEEEIEKRSHETVFTVSKVQTAGFDTGTPAAFLVSPIHVCSKKNCWRSGGRELDSALRQALDQRGLAGLVEVREVDCLDHCKHAPNCEWSGHVFSRCSPRDATWIVEQVAAGMRAK